MTDKYKCLYYFLSDHFSIVEIKRTDLGPDATPAELYHWLLIDLSSGKIQKLQFKSMAEGSRVFEQGNFLFDDKKGIFESNREQIQLSRSNEDLSEKVKALLQKYLKDLSSSAT